MGIQCKHMAERLQIDGVELTKMENGKKPITQAMADTILREQKRHFARMYSR